MVVSEILRLHAVHVWHGRNPTLVALTDRNDLDDQPLGQFQRCADSAPEILDIGMSTRSWYQVGKHDEVDPRLV